MDSMLMVSASMSEFEASAIDFNERTVETSGPFFDLKGALMSEAMAMSLPIVALDVDLRHNIDAAIARTASCPHYFWSGRVVPGRSKIDSVLPIAQRIAAAAGGTTLEMTIQGVSMPSFIPNDPSSTRLWEYASAQYGLHASGEVFFVRGDVPLRDGNVWEKVELPSLKKGMAVTKIYEIKVNSLWPEEGVRTEEPRQIYPEVQN
ncbi:hypothetical protein BKA62DRAFT_695800 [Auriculariales sp. MPI-PUGE-AT-0066]|nr:hypothetical protein BKA62DRAFT_695800 [Auriculariales sp. MPI-PUGE-AT-0066]